MGKSLGILYILHMHTLPPMLAIAFSLWMVPNNSICMRHETDTSNEKTFVCSIFN